MRDSKSFFVIKTDLTKVYVKKCILLYYDTDTVLGFKTTSRVFSYFQSLYSIWLSHMGACCLLYHRYHISRITAFVTWYIYIACCLFKP